MVAIEWWRVLQRVNSQQPVHDKKHTVKTIPLLLRSPSWMGPASFFAIVRSVECASLVKLKRIL